VRESKDLARETGITALGRVPWGTHICLFYQSKTDLLNLLPPYFKAGLEMGELCIWVTSEFLSAGEVENTMRKSMPDFDAYLERGQIEILPHSQWYLSGGNFDMQRVLRGWTAKLNQALMEGYAGIRVTGDTAWLGRKMWKNFANYEHEINEAIWQYRMIVVCSYCLDKCGTRDLIDVVNNHQLGLIKDDGEWTLTKNAERIRSELKAREYQAQLQSLASELSLIEEREKHRIAAELHDRISQSLVVSKIKLESLTKSVSGRELGKTLNEICSTLSHTIEDARSLIHQLSSPVLYELGLEAAIADCLSEEIEKRHGIKTELEDDKQTKPLDKDTRALLYRDVKELLCNVVKHSRANKVKISICRIGDQVCVSVKDNGVGFNVAEITSRAVSEGAFGLFSIRERLEQLGGQLKVESEPGHGCKVTMMAPLKLQENTNNGGMS